MKKMQSIFSMNLRYNRLINSYTQRYMAEMLSLTRSGYAKWELGAGEPAMEQVPRIANVLGIDISALFDETMTEERVLKAEEEMEEAARRERIERLGEKAYQVVVAR